MLDPHCHILPGVDDGASDITEAVDMARIAVADGITVIACTPSWDEMPLAAAQAGKG